MLSNEQLCALAASDLAFLREAAAAHPCSTPDLLATLVPHDLSNDVAQRIANALALNPSTPSDVLERLLGLLDPQVLDGSRRENWPFDQLAVNVLRHPRCPVQAGLGAIGHSARGLRIRMAEAVANPAFLEKLASDLSETVSSIAKARLHSPGA
jgi:hypothetical protein